MRFTSNLLSAFFCILMTSLPLFAQATIRVVDDLEKEIVLSEPAIKIISLAPNITLKYFSILVLVAKSLALMNIVIILKQQKKLFV